jgi:hypothetical protein
MPVQLREERGRRRTDGDDTRQSGEDAEISDDDAQAALAWLSHSGTN